MQLLTIAVGQKSDSTAAAGSVQSQGGSRESDRCILAVNSATRRRRRISRQRRIQSRQRGGRSRDRHSTSIGP